MSFASKYNFERKYTLSQNINSNKIRIYASGEKNLLFAETSNRCPKCGNPLQWNTDEDINSKENQIAHIYGKKLFADKGLPLDKKYHIYTENEINKYHNLIILCEKCHKDYDKEPTYDKYTNILECKERIAKNLSDKTYIYFALKDILEKIENGVFSNLYEEEKASIEDYQRQKLENKLKYNNINSLKSKTILNNVSSYFIALREIFENMERNDKEQLKEYKKVYLELKEKENDKNKILNIINDALIGEDSQHLFGDVIPIITSYMIMNCEVLDREAE